MRRLMVAAGLLVVAVAQAGAQGDPGRGGPPDGRGGGRGGRGGPEGAQMQACRVGADSLTEVQKKQVDQLAQQFETANKLTLDSLKALSKEPRQARMAAVRSLQESLKPALDGWHASMASVLTKSQLDKGCVPPPPGGPPGGPPRGRRGGPPPRDYYDAITKTRSRSRRNSHRWLHVPNAAPGNSEAAFLRSVPVAGALPRLYV